MSVRSAEPSMAKGRDTEDMKDEEVEALVNTEAADALAPEAARA